MRKATAPFLAMLVVLGTAAGGPAAAQAPESRPAEPRSAERPRTAEEHHAARRQWLEQQRLGDTAAAQPSYGGARGPRPPAGGSAEYHAADPQRGPVTRFAPRYGRYGPPAGMQLDAWCIAQLHPVRGPYGGLPTVAVQALCMPQPQPRGPDGASRYPHWSVPGQRYDPGYPPVNRFHERFLPPQDRTPHVPAYGTGLYMAPPDPWRPPPWYWGVEPTGCAEVRASGLSGSAVLHVGLPALGAITPGELELAMEARLARGQPVELPGLDGRWLVIPAGTELDHLSARSCPLR